MTILDQKLLDILVCPVSKKPLEYDKEANELISTEAGLAYPVKDGIPVTRNIHKSLSGLTLSDFLIFNKWLNH